MTRIVPVKLERIQQCYDLTIEPGLIRTLGERCADVLHGRRALLVIDDAITDTHGRDAAESLNAAGFDIATIALPARESEKTLGTVSKILDAALAHSLDRSGAIISVAGGLVGDVAGFASATYLRGIQFVQVPTTLLAMVDASTGGKTGVNFELPGQAGIGKNLVGAFWQPAAVLIDPQTLTTLDDRQFRCGLAETMKHGMVSDTALLDRLESCPIDQLRADAELAAELIEQSVRVKVCIVEQDEREAGVRAHLNLGHTFAHAIEPIADLGLFHGEAVAIGLIAACEVARQMDRMSDAECSRIRALIEATGLPTAMSTSIPVQDLLDRMMFDKKVLAGHVRLVVPRGLGAADVIEHVPSEVILRAWVAVGAAG